MFVQRRMNRIPIAALALAATLVAVSGCGSSGPGGSTDPGSDTAETVDIVAGVAPSMSSLNLYIGIEQGFFEEEGLNVTTAPVGTGAAGVTSLINGEFQVALGGLSGTITAVSQGIPVAFVSGGIADGGEDGNFYATLVSPDSDITSFKDLEGKTVALNSLNCCWEFWTRESVIADGGDADAVEFVQLAFAQQADALASGQVDAITTQQPFATQAELRDFVTIGNPAAIAYDNPTAGTTNYFMAQSFIDENPGVVERWRSALQKSADYANENPDLVREEAVELVSLDPDLVEATPVPNFVVDLDLDAIEKETGWLLEHDVIQDAPSVEDTVAP